MLNKLFYEHGLNRHVLGVKKFTPRSGALFITFLAPSLSIIQGSALPKCQQPTAIRETFTPDNPTLHTSNF